MKLDHYGSSGRISRMNMQVRPEVHALIRALAMERRTNMVDLLEEFIAEHLQRRIASDWDTQGESHAG